MEQEAIEIEATVAEETDDVVRIMTMHGAKGLEFPIVALANLGGTGGTQRAPVPREHESFLHFRVGAGTVSRTGHFATPGYDEVWEAEKRYGEAERLRLLYVAATRAREHLLVPCVVGRAAAKGLLGSLVCALPDDPSLVEVVDAEAVAAPAIEVAEIAPVEEPAVESAVAGRAAWIAERAVLRERAAVEREIETATSRERAVGPLAAEVATFGTSLLVADSPPIPVGDAVHMVMERVSLPDATDLEAIANDVCLEGDIAEHEADVVAMCRACLQAGSVQRALAGGRWWREVPFVVSREVGAASEGALATGRVDLVHQDGDELVVIDYKTDRDVTAENAEAHALDKHSGQAEIYAQAFGSATGMPVREVVFIYCKAGVEVRLREGEVVRA
jgi:ATP-dependent helicase/nuclease subunit A